jgi:acetate kinase
MAPPTTAPGILCVNSGSSTLKWAVYETAPEERRRAHGVVTGVRADQVRALREVFAALDRQGLRRPAAVGHRLVHGGPDYTAPRLVDAPMLAALRRLVPLAPLHLPSELDMIEAVAKELPDVPQVACFDTAFHRAMPDRAQRLPLPRALWDAGVRRYGFHGLSYEYVVWTLGPALPARAVLAHLGNGVSLVALRDRRPVDTTMGLTPLGGVMMGTRTGDLDPGVPLFLLREKAYDVERLATVLGEESGLLGVSGTTSDMKTLLELRERDARAAEAVAMFSTSVRKQIGAFAALLGGLDTLVFTGAIGEHAAPVRAEICAGLEHLGIRLDPVRNAANAEVVGAGPCTVRVVATNEELMLARQTAAAVGDARRASR